MCINIHLRGEIWNPAYFKSISDLMFLVFWVFCIYLRFRHHFIFCFFRCIRLTASEIGKQTSVKHLLFSNTIQIFHSHEISVEKQIFFSLCANVLFEYFFSLNSHVSILVFYTVSNMFDLLHFTLICSDWS